MSHNTLIVARWRNHRRFFEGLIHKTSSHSMILGLSSLNERFENPLYDSDKIHRTTSD